METEFQITRDDYVSAGLLNGEMKRKTKIVHYVIDIVLIISGIIVAFYAKNIVLASGLIGAAIGGNLLPYLLRTFYVPWHLKRHYEKYNAMKRPVSILLQDEGVKFTSDHGSGLFPWEDIHHWRENNSLILIYLAPRIYYVVPKRIEEEGFSVNTLTKRLIEHIGAAS